MTQTPRGWDTMEPLCRRIHNGEFKTHIEAESGISVTTLNKYYREWCRKNDLPPIQSRIMNGVTAHFPRPDHIAQKPDHPTTAPPRPLSIPKNATVLAVPDLHCPFQHQDSLAFLKAVRDKFKPDTVVILGDEADFHSFSRYIPDPDGLSPGKELAKAIEALTPFYIEFPEVYVCESNHTVRPLRKSWESGLPAAFLPTYAKMLNAPDGWNWRQYWVIDGVRYHHGDGGRSGQFAPAQYLKVFKQSHVHGHLHSHASVMYEGGYFGMNAGCLIDPMAFAFKYAKNAPVPVNLGCGIIKDGREGHFIPMLLDDDGRWRGKL